MEHEESLVEAFVVVKKRNRMKELLLKKKKRSKFLSLLPHFSDLDPRFVKDIPPNQQTPGQIYKILKEKGALDKCYIISSDPDIDQKIMKLSDTLDIVVGSGYGTLISCVPGKLGYYEGESHGDRCILER